MLQRRGEPTVEVAQHGTPVPVVALDQVEPFLEILGVGHLHQHRERLDEHVGDDFAHRGRMEASVDLFHVATVLDDSDDRCVGRWPADAFLFELLDQRAFVVSRWGAGEFLLGCDRERCGLLAILRRRAGSVRRWRWDAGDSHETVEDQHSAVCLENRPGGLVASFEEHGGGIELRGGHLAGHVSFPDQLVELVLIFLERASNRVGRSVRLGRPNRFMCFLCGLVRGAEEVRFLREVVRPERLLDVVASIVDRFAGQGGGIGTHVGDQADLAFALDLNALIQALCESHGSVGGEAQLFAAFCCSVEVMKGA